jgi:hypothetical protein
MKLVSAFVIALGVAGMSQAAFALTGNESYPACKAFDREDSKSKVPLWLQSECAATVNTAYRLGPFLMSELRFCPPQQSSMGQALSIVVKHMTDNPDKRHYELHNIAVLALRQAWPCPK